MENAKDYNFFYINEKDNEILKVLITASLGEGKYDQKEIEQLVDNIQSQNTQGKINLYQDDGENFWNLADNTKLDIGTKEDNFANWDDIKDKALVIGIDDLLVFAQSSENKIVKKYKH